MSDTSTRPVPSPTSVDGLAVETGGGSSPIVPKRTAAATSIVKLNVGGYKFTTSRATLCRFPGTFLETMFSDRLATNDCGICPTVLDPDDGSYFIDRDGRHFHHVMNYLRIGSVVSLPSCGDARAELAAEADFYGLDDLVTAIRQPQVDIAIYLSPEVQRIREEEADLRKVFASSSNDRGGYDIHHGLISLFAGPEDCNFADSCYVAPLRYAKPELKEKDALCMASLRDRKMLKGEATCSTLETFRTTFNRNHPNVLNRLEDILQEEPVVIAGGSVLHALTAGMCKTRTNLWWGGDSDVDLFVYGVQPEEANRITQRIFDSIALDNESWGIVRSRGVINLHQFIDEQVAQKIQIVLRIYDSPTEILIGFDADCCCCAYDGRDVWLSKRCAKSLMTGMNILNPIHAWPNRASYEMRLAKYAYRGFPVLVPGLDESRIDFERIQQTDISNLKGLARLLKISQEMESSASTLRPTGSLSWQPPTGYKTSLLKASQVASLKKEDKLCRDDAEIVVNGCGWYESIGPYNVLVPRVYCREHEWNHTGEDRTGVVPVGLMWWSDFQNLPRTRSTRDEAWAELVECESPPEGVPGRLVDAWDTEKRSREYLNAKMDSFDLDNLYYSYAYKA